MLLFHCDTLQILFAGIDRSTGRVVKGLICRVGHGLFTVCLPSLPPSLPPRPVLPPPPRPPLPPPPPPPPLPLNDRFRVKGSMLRI